MSIPIKCSVYEGSGKVTAKLYSNWGKFGEEVPCRTCGGKSQVWSKDKGYNLKNPWSK